MAKETIDFLTGNEAAAYGAKLAKIQVISAYPITPQSPITEKLSEFVNNGELEAPYLNVEGEHSCMGALIGAAFTGCRVFTASCGQGLAYMHEQIHVVHNLRLPIVMAVPNRALSTHIFCDHSDTMAEATCGWIQIFTENPQEVLDMMIQAFKIAEDRRVLLPVMVCFDGFVTSHTGATISVPSQDMVDQFLPRMNNPYAVSPSNPSVLQFYNLDIPKMEWEHEQAMQMAKEVIKEVNEQYAAIFGRSYGNGLVEQFMCQDAEAVILTSSSTAGTAREVVANLRNKGERIGLVKLRSFRPFPEEELQAIASRVKAIAVLDRNETHGSNCGEFYKEVRSALYDLNPKPQMVNYIVGLGGADVRYSDIEKAAETALEIAKTGQIKDKIVWLL